MTSLYRHQPATSTQIERRWRTASVLLAAVVVAGLAGLIPISAGAADPTRAGPLAWTNAHGDAPPFSLEAESDSRESISDPADP